MNLELLTRYFRLSCFAGAGVCISSLAIAYFYMERYLLLEPCPLCILDRFAVGGMFFCFLAMAFWKNWRRLWWGLNALCLSAGFIFAGRHIWLQYRPPDESAGCLGAAVPESYMEIIRSAFDAQGDCGAVYWQFLGMSIPEQVMLLFFAFGILLAAQGIVLFRGEPKQQEEHQQQQEQREEPA